MSIEAYQSPQPPEVQPAFREQVHRFILKPSEILYIGVGMGNEVIDLARHGHKVTGIDNSVTMLSTTQEQAEPFLGQIEEHGGGLTLIEKDVREPLNKNVGYDAIFMRYVLQSFPERSEIEAVINNIQDATIPNGHNFLGVYIGKDDDQEKVKGIKLQEPDEVSEVYYLSKGWTIPYREQKIEDLEYYAGNFLVRSKDEFVAQKPDL